MTGTDIARPPRGCTKQKHQHVGGGAFAIGYGPHHVVRVRSGDNILATKIDHPLLMSFDRWSILLV